MKLRVDVDVRCLSMWVGGQAGMEDGEEKGRKTCRLRARGGYGSLEKRPVSWVPRVVAVI